MSLLRLTSLFAFLLSSGFATAQDWYQVEIIIFEHAAEVQAEQDQENWPNDLDLAWPSPLIELEPAVEREQQPQVKPAFEELVFDERSLNNDSYALRTRSAYKLLWHKAWRAPMQPEVQAPWIQVQAGEQLGEHYRLEGAIRVHLSRYLHLHTNLWLTEISGEPIVEEPLPVAETPTGDVDATGAPAVEDIDIDRLAEGFQAGARFDWSQLPEPQTVRWGCNYIMETWPEPDRLLPADYYEDPAPADWYFPFGCRLPSEVPGALLPQGVPIPISSLDANAELQRHYPELTTQENNSDSVGQQKTQSTSQVSMDSIDRLLITETDTGPELLGPPPRVSYQVEEIVHIQSQRRIRSGEHHYIDHPKIGVLAIITPVEKPELELEAGTDNGSE